MNRVITNTLSKCRYFCSIANYSKIETNNIKQIVPLERIKSRIDPQKLPPKTRIDSETIALLERLSLVDCESKEAINILEAKLEFADQILQVETRNVEPLVTPLEDIPLRLREDLVTEGNCRGTILNGASLIEEEYFVAPPGNIPLETREDLLHDKDVKESS